MKRFILVLFLLAGISALSFAASTTSNTFVAGKSLTSMDVSSSTVNFIITDVNFSLDGAAGSYATITSSWAKTTSDYLYVRPSHDIDKKLPIPIDMRGSAMRIQVTITPGDTFYYYIGGHK
jgi:hypothetical protein